MPWFRRTLFAAGLLAATSLAGCALFSGSTFDLPDNMPSDFALGLQVKEATEPPIDYIVKVARSGRVEYATTIRAPRRREFSGEAELTEAQVVALYDAVLAAGFDRLDDVYEAGDGTADARKGVRYFYVYAAALDKRIDVQLTSVPALDELQARIVEILPKHILDATAAPEIDRTTPETFVANTESRQFHLPGCERAKEIPAGGKREFRTQYEALDFGFHPCPLCEPLNVRK